jgi:hypothetical protein
MGPEFYNMAGSPFVLIRNSVIDSRSGKAVISKEKDGFKYVEDYEVIPALNSILVRTTGSNGMLQLYLIGSDNGEVKWKTDVMKPSLIIGMNEEPDEVYVDVPLYTSLVTPDKHLIFHYRKNLAVISPEGKLLWNEKADPAEVLLSPDGKKVLALKALVTGIGNSPVTVRRVIKYRSTKIAAYDLKTGKESWKADIKTDQNIRWADAHPNFLAVVQAKACNIYNYATGEAYWKDDFKGRRVVEIAPNAEGYLVTYESGYKTMQVSKSGVALWKKPQIVETDDDEDDSPDDGDQNVYQYAKGKVLINAERARFRPAKGSGLKKWRLALDARSRAAYDDSLKNILILHDNKLYVVNPDRNPQVGKPYPVDFENLSAFHTVEFRPKGYFLTSSSEFIVFDPATGKLAHRYYPSPFDSKGLFISVVNAQLSVQRATLRSQAAQNYRAAAILPPGTGNTERMKAAQQQNLAADALSFALSSMPPARVEAFKQSPDFAYYFAENKSDKLLVKVSKDTGAETDKLIFDDARPIYQVDEIERRVYYANKSVLKVFNLPVR